MQTDRNSRIPSPGSPGSDLMARSVLTRGPHTNPLINLAYLGALLLVAATLMLGIGLVRTRAELPPVARSACYLAGAGSARLAGVAG